MIRWRSNSIHWCGKMAELFKLEWIRREVSSEQHKNHGTSEKALGDWANIGKYLNLKTLRKSWIFHG